MPCMAFCSAVPTLAGVSRTSLQWQPCGHLEAVLVGEVLPVGVDRFLVLLVPHIADALEEEQRQDIAFPVRAVHRAAAQDIGSFPEMRLKLGQGDGLVEKWRLPHVAPKHAGLTVK